MNIENKALIKALNMFGRIPEQWELLEEIERLNNIINELEEDIKNYKEILEQGITDKVDYIYLGSVLQFLNNSLDKLQELKGNDENE